MSERHTTRYARHRPGLERSAAANLGTRVSTRDRLESPSLEVPALFNRHQRRMEQVLVEHPHPGVAFFAIHEALGFSGHAWLSSTESLRACTLGRHGVADLWLADDPMLSLRHAMMLVKRTPDDPQPWIRVCDLESTTGLRSEIGTPVRALEARGSLVFRSSEFVVFAFETGKGRLWDRESVDAWASFQMSQRRVIAEAAAAPLGPETYRVLPHEEPVGELSIQDDRHRLSILLGPAALERGVFIGRDARCFGSWDDVDPMLSRIHAAVIAHEGQAHLIDTASTNGIWSGDREVKCERMAFFERYRLGMLEVCWSPR